MFNMSTRELRHLKMRLEVDLNVPLRTETREQVAARSLVDLNVQRGGSVPCHPIDLEATDDDDEIVVSSLTEFAEAVNNSRGTRRSSVLIDLDSGLLSRVASNSHSSKRRRASKSQAQINEDLCIDLDGCSKCGRTDVPTMAVPPPPPPPPPPTFTCPVCMGPLVEEMSTKCGHIFCKKCIKAAISTKRTCPTCRSKISMRNTIRVYLPATN